MISFLWARTLLTAYRYVPKVVKSVDSVVEEHALKSSGFNCSGFSRLSTLNQINKIVELTELKQRAIFIRDYVQKTISKLSIVKQNLLSQIFFENKKITQVVMRGEFSPRTHYRRIQESLSEFEENMNKQNYKISDFERDFKDNWIIKIQELLLKENSQKPKNTVYKKSLLAA